MAVLKVVEILAESKEGWEDAAQNAVNKASQTVQNIKSVYIQDMSATVDENDILRYRVNAKITFEVS